jgi:hypothetical protein
MITDAMFAELAALYRNYNSSTSPQEFLRRQRHSIRILVDSLWEQLTRSLPGEAPRNAIEARRKIAEHQQSSSEDMHLMLRAMADVLQNYEILIKNPYSAPR